jgi:hypothetical protein
MNSDMDSLPSRDTSPGISDPILPNGVRQRERDLEAQIAELKQDKERLLGLLDQALAALNNPINNPLVHDSYRLPPSPLPHAPTRAAAKPAKEEFVPGTWAWLKNWFLNA